MNVEEIPSDELVGMTELFHRAFNAAGCNPACHCCYNKIPVGDNFKLATVRIVNTDYSDSARTARFFAKERLDVINGDIAFHHRVDDVSREVMLCASCTVDLFQEKQLSKAKKDVEEANNFVNSGGGCFRINGKIVH